MKIVLITKEYAISRCLDCPNFTNSQEGPYCSELEKKGAYKGMIWNKRGYEKEVSSDCPFFNY